MRSRRAIVSSSFPVRVALRSLLVISLASAATGCAGPGFFNFSSISVGTFNRGALHRGKRLAPRGEGYLVPPLWQTRGANFGTD